MLEIAIGRDSTTVWMDLNDPDPSRKFKAFAYVWNAPNGRVMIFRQTAFHWIPKTPNLSRYGFRRSHYLILESISERLGRRFEKLSDVARFRKQSSIHQPGTFLCREPSFNEVDPF